MAKQPIDLCDWIGTASLDEFKSEAAIRRYFSQARLRKMFGPEADLSGREAAMGECLRQWNAAKRRKARG